MKTVQRYDVGSLQKPEVTPAGFLRADGHPTKAGIFVYRNPDGTTRRELRPEAEVFKTDSLRTLQLAPVTDDHPPANLTAATAAEFQRGSVGESVHQDGDLVRATMIVTDGKLRDKMMKGKQALSCGYTCDVFDEPGEWRGQRYDAVQKNIRYNHLAVVDRGRAGADARVRMDAADAGMLSDPEVGSSKPTPQEKTLKTFRFDGVTYEAPEQTVELLEKLSKGRKDAEESLVTAKADAQKRVDAAEAARDQAKVELEKAKADAAKMPATIRAELSARMDLEQHARGFLGKAEKFDGKTDREVRVAVLKKLQPKADVAGKSDDYVSARFDLATEEARRDSGEELATARRQADPERSDADPEEHDKYDSDAAQERMKKANRKMWQEPIGRQPSKS